MKRLWDRFTDWWSNRYVDEEIESHLEERTADLMEGGMLEADARHQAHREFGNATLVAEQSREIWARAFFERFNQDIRYALRLMRRSPLFTSMAVISLALGIGANTAIFGLLDVILFRMLPVKSPQDIRVVATRIPSEKKAAAPSTTLSYPLYTLLRDQNQSMESLAGSASFRWKDKSTRTNSTWHLGEMVSGNYFECLGVRPSLGRLINPADDAKEAAGGSDGPVAVLSNAYWSRGWQLDPAVVGKNINVNGTSLTIVGITSPEFFGTQVGSSPDIFVPMQLQPVVDGPKNLLHDSPMSSSMWITVLGRAKGGFSESRAASDLSLILARYEAGGTSNSDQANGKSKMLPAPNVVLLPGGRGISLLREQFSEPLKLLMALVGVILLIACVNIATLLLARSDARKGEIAVRIAVGAGRARLVRQLLTESLLLSVLGGGLGLVFAIWSGGVLVRMLPQADTPLTLTVVPDLRVLGFTFGLTVLTGVLFGLAPALQATRISVNDALKCDLKGTRGGLKWSPGKLLVVAEVALAIPLIVGAGLLIGTFQNLITLDAGFVRENVLQAGVNVEAAGYSRAQWAQVYDLIAQRISTVPGVKAASLVNRGLMEEGRTRSGPAHFPDYTFQDGESRDLLETYIDAGYFAAAGIPFRRGRPFNDRDAAGPQVAIVNETLVRHYFNGQNPIGLHYGLEDGASPIEIVGVVADAKYNNLRQSPTPMAYYPWRQAMPARLNTVIIRSQGDPLNIVASVRQAIASIHPDIPQDIRTLSAQIDSSLVQERMLAQLSGFFGTLSLILACIGLYGVMAYAVSRRTAEIGVRIALGAIPRDVVWMVLRETLLLVACGIAIGVPTALGLTRFTGSFLYGVKPHDAMTFAAAAMAMALVAVFAGYLPARRAAGVEPLVTLRYE